MSQELKNTMKYREEWLHEAVLSFRPWFVDLKAPIPDKVYVSCGFPKGRHGSGQAIGQCWPPQSTTDGTTQMFVCPTQHEPVRVLDILLHECIHAGCGTECGHKGEFKRVARELGLDGKLTATYATEGTKLWSDLSGISEKLGPYPHSAMRLVKKEKKESNWIRLKSPEDDEYTLVISKTSIEEKGWPNDYMGNRMIPKKGDWQPGDGDDDGGDE